MCKDVLFYIFHTIRCSIVSGHQKFSRTASRGSSTAFSKGFLLCIIGQIVPFFSLQHPPRVHYLQVSGSTGLSKAAAKVRYPVLPLDQLTINQPANGFGKVSPTALFGISVTLSFLEFRPYTVRECQFACQPFGGADGINWISSPECSHYSRGSTGMAIGHDCFHVQSLLRLYRLFSQEFRHLPVVVRVRHPDVVLCQLSPLRFIRRLCHGTYCLYRVFTVRGFTTEHHRIGTIVDRVRDIGDLGSSGPGILNHGV